MSLLATLCIILLCSCKSANKKGVFDYDAVTYADLTEQDFQTIDYINQNSNIGFEFMGVMDDIDDPLVGPHTDFIQGIDCEGAYDTDEDKVFRNYIRYSQPITGLNVLGITIGTKYCDAKEILENAGFTWDARETFNSNTNMSSFSKGNVVVRLDVSSESAYDTNILDDDEISQVTLSIRLQTEQIDTRGIE
jgi:hypothetical protein